MALTPSVIVRGSAIRISDRTFTSKKTGEVYNFRNVTVIGDGVLVEARLADEHQLPQLNAPVAFRASVGAYNGEAEFRVEEFLPVAEGK
jgi:hypothetical protein